MNKKTTKIIVATFCAFVVLVSVMFWGVISNSPEMSSMSTAGNYPGTFSNGGHILDDEGFLYFINPQGGLYRTVSRDFDNPVLIDSDAKDYLQISGNRYYYLTNKGEAVSIKMNGSDKTVLLKDARNLQVAGSSIYYINNNNEVCRADVTGENATSLGVKTKGNLMYYLRKLYYIGEDNKIWTIEIDGANPQVYIDKQVESFFVDGSYLFYKSSGVVYSYRNTYEKILKAEKFMIKNNYILYQNEGAIYVADMDKLDVKKYSPKKIAEGEYSGFGIDSENFYCFDEEGNLYRVSYKGKIKALDWSK